MPNHTQKSTNCIYNNLCNLSNTGGAKKYKVDFFTPPQRNATFLKSSLKLDGNNLTPVCKPSCTIVPTLQK
ncbi:hypothetical protein NIES2109_45870 [Nostoc sp. HK-01]|uniref:NAD(P) transhydrogenase subunit alpha n=1 Tax=Nostoc cycadae WK-1 TaxID=1861711 RepID=A0A2H6LKW9_9NOSO|nr:hypothetical protein NIES2109_45870 [Nostoc sp. HK-01]GBE93875.1 NAD(P) transhydrogenase subunit alpha [Nostoc cycadae WK-1]